VSVLPLGKLPHTDLAKLLAKHAPDDPRVLLGPGVGLDCAVLDFGANLVVVKSDPITFTAEKIGWYAVHVNANDVATCGAAPRWFLATLLLPENASDLALAEVIFEQITSACAEIGAQLVGGHTEITAGLDRPILCGTMLGEVPREDLISPRGARPGDVLLLTKGVPIEATSILAHDFADRLTELPAPLVERARGYLLDPGISVVAEALAAAGTGAVTAMHDPTEGGLASGLWELALAANVGIEVDEAAIPIPPESAAVCGAVDINPLEAIASGALLLCVEDEHDGEVRDAIRDAGVDAHVIGVIIEGSGVFLNTPSGAVPLPHPARDALTRLFEDQ
jgi:hydrogenase maturation factor